MLDDKHDNPELEFPAKTETGNDSETGDNSEETEQETEEEIENENQRCLTPSNTYLEVSFEANTLGATPKVTNLYKDFVHHSTPNNGKLN